MTLADALLADVHDAFKDRPAEAISTRDLVAFLIAEGKRWNKPARRSSPLTQRRLAYEIRRFGVESSDFRFALSGEHPVLRAYRRDDVLRAWAEHGPKIEQRDAQRGHPTVEAYHEEVAIATGFYRELGHTLGRTHALLEALEHTRLTPSPVVIPPDEDEPSAKRRSSIVPRPPPDLRMKVRPLWNDPTYNRAITAFEQERQVLAAYVEKWWREATSDPEGRTLRRDERKIEAWVDRQEGVVVSPAERKQPAKSEPQSLTLPLRLKKGRQKKLTGDEHRQAWNETTEFLEQLEVTELTARIVGSAVEIQPLVDGEEVEEVDHDMLEAIAGEAPEHLFEIMMRRRQWYGSERYNLAHPRGEE